MSKKLLNIPHAAWIVSLLVTACLVPSQCVAEDVTLKVDCSEATHAIGPRLIGAFFEDINFGGDGGLNAELVKNGSFEVPVPLLGWSTEGEGTAMRVERDAPMSAANPSFVRVRVEGEPGGAAVNEGYRRMGLHGGEEYRLTLYGRVGAGKETKITAVLVAEDGESLAEKTMTINGSAWKEHEAILAPSRTEARAELKLRLDSGEFVDLDLVSLCPVKTWGERPHGLRRDLVQLLKDLQPGFFRFPGGCIVEGSELKYRYQWKTTIGPREERRLIVNRWNYEFGHRPTPDYFQSFGVGFFEYFQLSEDIGAEPLPIINCGMACQFNSGELVPLEELDPYIQDALDLIEFANGSVDSEWGARRAEMGHPEPFNMRLLGVGNEQWGPEYFERYKVFAEVLEREHPEIELISTSGPFPSGERFDYAWPVLRRLNVPIVDEHCYAVPDWFFREAHRYDKYDRGGPEVFMGEYAAQSVQIVSVKNRNNLRAALSEAAFLTGIQRNSDIVTMSAYAPLSAHVDAWQWRPNLIWFDNLTSCGTPSYYVQQLFSRHRGDESLAVELADERPAEPIGGRVGFGAYNTHVELRDIRVEDSDGNVLSEGPASVDDLVVHQGEWRIDGGVVSNVIDRGPSRAMFGDTGWGDATLTFKVRKLAGREGFAVFFRGTPGESKIEWNVGGWGNRQHGLIDRQATHSDTPRELERADGSIDEERWYDVRIELRGESVKCYLDDKLVHDVSIPRPQIDRVFACASRDSETGQTIIKVVNRDTEPTAVRVGLDGLPSGAMACHVIELTGDPTAENTVDDPNRVAPREHRESVIGPEFSHSFAPNSLTILRIGDAAEN